MKPLLLPIILSIFVTACSQGTRAPQTSTVVTTQSIGAKYKLSDESLLIESAKQIQRMGSDTLKVALTPKYQDDYMMEADPEIRTSLDLFKRKPEFTQVFNMPFKHVMFWLYPFADTHSAFRLGHIPEDEAEGIYNEIYDFTSYLLKEYNGSGKSFYIGNWEGDWHLMRERYDYSLDPDQTAIDGTIAWFKLREKAVADARRNTPHEDVQVFFYIELNHVKKAIDDDRPAIVNKVLPHIKTDFVSWSSYDVTKEAAKIGGQKGKKMVIDALNYIEAHLPPSDVQGKRVMIGEYGFENDFAKNPETQAQYTASIIKWGLEWGCPFIIYWELYCNEIDPKTGENRGYWLIDREGQEQPVWHLHTDFLKKANAYKNELEAKNGPTPNQAEFNQAANNWL